MKRTLNDLNTVVLRAINGLEAGESKQEAIQSITSFVGSNYIKKATFADIGNLPLEDAVMLNDVHGLEFSINDGKIKGIRFGEINHHSDKALVG